MAALLKYLLTKAAEPFHKRARCVPLPAPFACDAQPPFTPPRPRSFGRPEAQARAAYTSRTAYVGNLAFVTTDVQLYALFSRAGTIDRVVMGINRETKQPCGFAYVIFMERRGAVDAVNLLHNTVLDERVVKVEMDKGFHEGKQYGRGALGGQVRDELRDDYDEGRSGMAGASGRREGG